MNTYCIEPNNSSIMKQGNISLISTINSTIQYVTNLTTFFKIYLIIKFLPDGNSAPNIELAEGI
jgi:hypothetical protein